MRDFKTISYVLLIGVIFFFFIEAFYNVLVNINAYIFMNLSNIISLIPSLMVLIILIIVEFYFFTSGKIRKILRAHLLIYIIAGLRIATQFIIIPNLIFILNFLVLFSIMIFFIGFLLLMEAEQKSMSIFQFLASIIIGLGLQYVLLLLDTSSNLTSNVNKLIPNFIFLAVLIFINNFLFFPHQEQYFITTEVPLKPSQTEFSLLHFLSLGILFLYCMMYLLNPMALSAYDSINLGIIGISLNTSTVWPSYGYTYYVFIILLSAILSYVFTLKCLLSLRVKWLKLLIGILGILTCFLTLVSTLLIENDFTLFSTVYQSISVVIGVFFMVLYITYLFHFYYFKKPKKLIIGVTIFILAIFSFIILHVEILWGEYLSLLAHVSIQIISAITIIFLTELRFFKKTAFPKERLFKFHKAIPILFSSVLIVSGIIIGVTPLTRIIKPAGNEKLTFMVWNIHNAIGDDDIFLPERIVEDIKLNNPDILGLNEVDLGALKTSFIDLPSYFSQKLNMYYFYGYTFYKHYGNVLLSKYPIIDVEIIQLPLIVQSAEPRSLIRAKIEINSTVWTLFLTHLSTEADDRLAQIPFIVNTINQEFLFNNVVWMGDFNLEPSSIAYSLINSTTLLNFTDTYSYLNSDLGYTGDFNENHLPQKRIDYIMFSPDIIPTESEVFCSIASDHCAVITRV